VREVTAGVVVHAEQPLVQELVPERLPVGVGDVGHVLLAKLRQPRPLDGGGEDREERDQVGVGAGVWLHVHVLGAEQLAAEVGGLTLDRVDVVAPGVEAVPRIPLGVLVGQQVALRQLHRDGAEVLAGDQLQVGPLVAQLLDDRVGDGRRHAGDHVQRGVERGGPGVDLARIGGGKIPAKQAALSHRRILQNEKWGRPGRRRRLYPPIIAGGRGGSRTRC
jgi:hypothetical protein